MPYVHPSLADIVRQSAEMARRCADTARLHGEPAEAERFEQFAAEGEARARHLDNLIRAYQDTEEPLEPRLIRARLMAVHDLMRYERR